MLILTRLKLEGFFGVTRADIPLDGQGLVLVTGQNGAGKTALVIESLVYALYGASFEYGKVPGGDVVNWRIGHMLVELHFTVNEQTYTIRRTRDHPEFGTKLTLLHGKKDISLGTGAATQSVIDMIIGVNFDGFASSSVFSTDLLRFPDYPDARKKEIIEGLLGVAEADAALAKAKEQRALAVRERDMVFNDLSSAKSARLRTQRELDTLPDIVVFEDSDAARLDTVTAAAAKWAMELEQARTAQRIATENSNAINTRLHAATAPLQQELTEVATNRRQAEAALSTVTRELRETACPSCLRPWGDEHKRPLQEKQERYLAAIHTCNTAIQEIQTEKDGISSSFSADKWDADQSAIALSNRVRHVESQLSAANREMASLSSKRDKSEGAAEQRALAVQEKTHHLAELDETIAAKETEVEKLEVEVQNLSVIMDCFGSKGAKVLVLQNAIPRLNAAAAQTAAYIAPGIDVSFHADSDKGNLQILVDNPNGAKKYHGSSAGERRKIDMVVLFALMSLRRFPVNVLAIDEAFEKLSPDAQDEMAQYLRGRAATISTIFMINHTAGTISQYADQVWEMNRGELLLPNAIGKENSDT